VAVTLVEQQQYLFAKPEGHKPIKAGSEKK